MESSQNNKIFLKLFSDVNPDKLEAPSFDNYLYLDIWATFCDDIPR